MKWGMAELWKGRKRKCCRELELDGKKQCIDSLKGIGILGGDKNEKGTIL